MRRRFHFALHEQSLQEQRENCDNKRRRGLICVYAPALLTSGGGPHTCESANDDQYTGQYTGQHNDDGPC